MTTQKTGIYNNQRVRLGVDFSVAPQNDAECALLRDYNHERGITDRVFPSFVEWINLQFIDECACGVSFMFPWEYDSHILQEGRTPEHQKLVQKFAQTRVKEKRERHQRETAATTALYNAISFASVQNGTALELATQKENTLTLWHEGQFYRVSVTHQTPA